MSIEPVIGMAIALFGVPILMVAVRFAGADPLRLVTRLAMWAMAAAVIWLAQTASPNWHTQLGLRQPSGSTAVYALVGAVLALAAWPIIGFTQRAFGGTKVTDTEAFHKLIGIAPAYRAFLVVTAGVTEEVLFRAYAIGVGTQVLGSVWVAFTLSLLVFVAAHFRWGGRPFGRTPLPETLALLACFDERVQARHAGVGLLGADDPVQDHLAIAWRAGLEVGPPGFAPFERPKFCSSKLCCLGLLVGIDNRPAVRSVGEGLSASLCHSPFGCELFDLRDIDRAPD